ncbi:ankyrin repeat-containing domain protein [Haematococcus lacustris]
MGASISRSEASCGSVGEILDGLDLGDYSPFRQAVLGNRKLATRVLKNGNTGIHLLAAKGSVDGIRAIVDAVLEARAHEKGRPLNAVECKEFTSKLLNIVNEKGRTPLMVAARSGQEACFAYLLQNQVEVWARDKAGGATALHLAAGSGHEGILTQLHAHAAHHPSPVNWFDMANINGLTPLHFAVFNKRHKVVTMLCDMGANLYSCSVWSCTNDVLHCNAGSTPLHVAAFTGSTRTTKALLKAYVSGSSPGASSGRSWGKEQDRRMGKGLGHGASAAVAATSMKTSTGAKSA